MTRALDPATITLDGIQLIEASAGTGKTYTITQLFIRLLVEKNLEIENILVATFTEAATAELRDRIRSKLREALEECSLHIARQQVVAGQVVDLLTAWRLARRAR